MKEYVIPVSNDCLDLFLNALKMYKAEKKCMEEVDDYWTRVRFAVVDEIDLYFIGRAYEKKQFYKAMDCNASIL